MEKINRGDIGRPPWRHVFAKAGTHVQAEFPVTDENRHFFIFNKKTQQWKLGYQGSQIILDMLTLFKENGAFSRDDPRNALHPREKHLAFFDIYGTFHNFVLLDDLILDHGREGEPRSDVALFWEINRATGMYEHRTITVPEIYCLSLAPHPNMEEANGNN